MKNKVGRPKIEIDFETVKRLCELHCTEAEICDFLMIDEETLTSRLKDLGYKNFSEYFKKHQGKSKISLRRLQWKAAMKGSVPMLIWLGKQYLGQKDKIESDSFGNGGLAPINLVVTPISANQSNDN